MEARDRIHLGALLITALATLVVAVTGGFGYFLLKGELSALQTQNLQMEKALSQTYRPLGVVRNQYDRRDFMVYNTRPGDTKDKFTISYDLNLHNSGTGVLIDVGSFQYSSQELVDFRSGFLKGSIVAVILDKMYVYARMAPLLVGEERKAPLIWENLPFRDIYYFYSLHLYLDQDGNLYDTQHLNVQRFRVPTPSDSASLPIPLKPGSYSTDVFHKYTTAERRQLLERLVSLKSTIVPYLE